MSKSSPLKLDPFTIGLIVTGAGLAGQGISAFSGFGKRKQEQIDAENEYRKRFSDYEKLDTSNIYADIKNPYEAVKNPYADLDTRFENVFEDLTVNQQQAQFEKQAIQQQQSNILQGLRGAAGGSGIAGLAQAMANQGQLQAQRAAASIGAQEAQIQQLTAQGADQARRLQQQAEMTRMAGEEEANRIRMEGAYDAELKRLAGAETARELEGDKITTLLGMSQQRKAAAELARKKARENQMKLFSNITGLATQFLGGIGGGGMDMSGATSMPTLGANPSLPTGADIPDYLTGARMPD